MSMTRNQAIDLLSAIVAYDKRTVGEADVAAWTEAARRGDWEFDEALDAVHGYHLEHDEMIKPVHVQRAVRAARRTTLDKAAVPAQAPDLNLMRRLEALADSKAIDRADTQPVQLFARPSRRAAAGERNIADAVRRGERARAEHRAALEASPVEGPESHADGPNGAVEGAGTGDGASEAQSDETRGAS